MFEWLFKYPPTVFTRGKLVLLGAWPAWLLPLLILAATAGLALLIRRNLPNADPKLRSFRVWVVWAMQSSAIALILLLLWQPAVLVAELKSQQNIIAILVDDSRSMATPDANNQTREEAATRALNSGILTGLQKRFQTRLYRIDGKVTGIKAAAELNPNASATHLSEGLKQIAAETSDLPVGAIILLTDGAENTGGIDADTLSALRNRRLPVHTIGFGRETPARDLELEALNLTSTALADARLKATITIRQYGYQGQHTTLALRDGDKLLASKEVTLPPDGVAQTETLFLHAGPAGVKPITASVTALPNEENTANNSTARLLTVSAEKRRILYVEGEPRWEYKFLRRAAEDDHAIQVVAMLRTTENKIYRQGIASPAELADGFPSKAEDLFAYDGIIIGSVEANYLTPTQQELLREFVDKRGGGVLFLGGRFALTEGGWNASSASDLLPTFLPTAKGTFHLDPATAQLTPQGVESSITRLIDDPAANASRWKKLPYMMNYQDPGTPKPGATVLAQTLTGQRTLPLLVTQNYGHGRTAMLATSGTWRWQMAGAVGDPSHDLFWQQLLRWTAGDSTGPVSGSLENDRLNDEGHATLTAIIRDKKFSPAADAHVTAHINGPENSTSLVDLTPVPAQSGTFTADWIADKPGTYGIELTATRGKEELGHDLLTLERTDGVAENFHTSQNRDLLEKLSAQTGGRYWKPADLARLPQEISYSEAGISVRDTKELWNMPIVFFLLLALASGQWWLRRKWGIV